MSEPKKRISILTLHDVPNYGSVLQTFATQEIFKGMGLIPNVLNYKRITAHGIVRRVNETVKNDSLLKRIVKSIVYYFYFSRQEKVFASFRNKHLTISKATLLNEDDFQKLPIDSDIYCTGSDQTWNNEWYGHVLKSFFLTFVPNGIKKISYASSFGRLSLPEEEQKEVKQYLESYDAISLREESGVKIVKQLGFDGAVHVLDPTLQMGSVFWNQYIKKPKEEHYVLVYQLNKHPWFNEFVELFARKKGLKIIRFGAYIHQLFKSGKLKFLPTPFAFPSYIAYADYVITDSFHATAFSLNLHTTPICIYPDRFSSRLNDVLQLTHLERLHVKTLDDIEIFNVQPVCWDEVDCILENKRKIGYEYLKGAIKS